MQISCTNQRRIKERGHSRPLAFLTLSFAASDSTDGNEPILKTQDSSSIVEEIHDGDEPIMNLHHLKLELGVR